jgi:hypothetical protein
MSQNLTQLDRPTGAWIAFSYISFGVSLFLVGGGIFELPLDWWMRAYLAMGVTMVVQSSFTLAKNIRDLHEANRMINRIEEARTERLLSAERAKAAALSLHCESPLFLSSDTPCCEAGWLGPELEEPTNDQGTDVDAPFRAAVLGPVFLGPQR